VEWVLVAVKWEDITSLVRFSLSQDFEHKRLYKMSVGFVVKETDEYVVIADDVDLTWDRDSANNYGTLIPKGCIREWNVIKRYECVEGPPIWEEPEPELRPADPAHLRQLAEFLGRNPNLIATPRQLALRLGLAERAVEAGLAVLEKESLVWRVGDQVYCCHSGRKATIPAREEKTRRARKSQAAD